VRNRSGRQCAASSLCAMMKNATKGGAASSPHAVARPLPRPVNVLTAREARKRSETDDFQLVTDSTADSRIMLLLQSIGGFGGALARDREPGGNSRERRTIEVGSLLALRRPRDAAHSGRSL
jgi:hypothetical protein